MRTSRFGRIAPWALISLLVACTPATLDTPSAARVRTSGPSDAAAAASALASPSPEPTTPRFPALEWTPIQYPLAGTDHWTGATGTHEGFVAVGYRCPKASSYCSDPVGMTWTSPDGLTWSAHRVLEPRHVEFLAATTFGQRIVAIGDVPSHGNWRRLTLESNDGQTWNTTGKLEPPTGQPCVADGGGTTFCTGTVVGSTAWLQVTIDARTWLSRDGRAWQLINPAVVPQFKVGDGYQVPVIAAGSKGVVAATFAAEPGAGDEFQVFDRGRPAFWWSADGRDWVAGTASLADERYDADQVSAIVALASGYVAIGETTVVDPNDPGLATGTPSCWVSADGRGWTRHDSGPRLPQTTVPGFGGVISLDVGDDGASYKAVGTQGDCAWTESAVGKPSGEFWGPFLLASDDERVVILNGSIGGGWASTPRPI
jgi:hypothetical protein